MRGYYIEQDAKVKQDYLQIQSMKLFQVYIIEFHMHTVHLLYSS